MTPSKNKMNRIVGSMLAAVLFVVAIMPTSAFAGIAGTGTIAAEESVTLDRERLLRELDRDVVREQLMHHGVEPDEAKDRVSALTDEEIRELASDMEAKPAGAGIGLTTVLLVVVIYLLVR